MIYECAGSDITMDQAIQNARKGSTIILVAVFGKTAHVDLAKLNDSELDLNTSMMYRHEDYVDAIRLVKEGKIRLKPLMSARFGFRDYQKAYEYIDANHPEYTCVWSLLDERTPINGNGIRVRKWSEEYYRCLSTAKYLVNNVNFEKSYKKKKYNK